MRAHAASQSAVRAGETPRASGGELYRFGEVVTRASRVATAQFRPSRAPKQVRDEKSSRVAFDRWEDEKELDGDEAFALVASCILAGITLLRWYAALATVTRRAAPAHHRFILALVPFACLALVQGVLACCAAHEVKEAGEYDFLFLAGGAAWLGVTTLGLPLLDLCPRDDAIETRNPAAVVAVCGAWAGVMLCYAGGNIGEGPTIWTTFVPAAAATAALLLLWFLFEIATSASENVSIDRDVASSLRVAGFLVATGLVLGRAVAGDFHDWDGTWCDFLAEGWPALPIWALAIILQLALRPTRDRPFGSILRAGLLPATLLVVIAMADLLVRGRPEHLRGGR